MKIKLIKSLLFILFLGFFAFTAKTNVLAAASLSFDPASKTVALNETFSVNVVLNTGGAETNGVDAIIRYDGNKLEFVSAAMGSLYESILTPNPTPSTPGSLTLGAATTQTYNGTGTFAAITFKAIAEGTANVYFDFTADSTTDSNVAYQGEDLLGSISNASYTITPTGSSTNGNGTNGGVGGDTPVSIPESGTVENTIILLAGGIALLLLGGFKLLFR